MFDWDRAFVNTNVKEKVFILNKTILNTLSNFIPHETLTVDDKDPRPPPRPPLGLQRKLKISLKKITMFTKAIKIVKTTATYITRGD